MANNDVVRQVYDMQNSTKWFSPTKYRYIDNMLGEVEILPRLGYVLACLSDL
jgi:hypothetical protein